MLIQDQAKAINTTSFETSDFKINASAHAFKVLSSSLYENKKVAVIRELAANASDANKDNGKEDIPVTIQLPSDYANNLVVTDVGKGMSKEQLQHVYTTYFESTKTNSTDSIGGFGLGSKSPFALTDNFTVNSVTENGEETNIIAYLDGGQPKVSVTYHDKNSSKPSGTTVSVSIKEVDTAEIKKAIFEYYIFKYWKVFPKVIADSKEINDLIAIAEKAAQVTLSRDLINTQADYKYFVKDTEFMGKQVSFNSSQYNFTNIVYGNFSYQIPTAIRNEITEYILHVKRKNKVMFSGNFILYFPLTVVLELAPSRERIEDTKQNREVIFKGIDAVLDSYTAIYERSLEYACLRALSVVANSQEFNSDVIDRLNKIGKRYPVFKSICWSFVHYFNEVPPRLIGVMAGIHSKRSNDRRYDLPYFFKSKSKASKAFFWFLILMHRLQNIFKLGNDNNSTTLNIDNPNYSQNFRSSEKNIFEFNIYPRVYKSAFNKLTEATPYKQYSVVTGGMIVPELLFNGFYSTDTVLIPVGDLTTQQKEKLARILINDEYENNRPDIDYKKVLNLTNTTLSDIETYNNFNKNNKITFKKVYTKEEIVKLINSYNIKISGKVAGDADPTVGKVVYPNSQGSQVIITRNTLYSLTGKNLVFLSKHCSTAFISRYVKRFGIKDDDSKDYLNKFTFIWLNSKAEMNTKRFKTFCSSKACQIVHQRTLSDDKIYYFNNENDHLIESSLFSFIYEQSKKENKDLAIAFIIYAIFYRHHQSNEEIIDLLLKNIIGVKKTKEINKISIFNQIKRNISTVTINGIGQQSEEIEKIIEFISSLTESTWKFVDKPVFFKSIKTFIQKIGNIS